MGGKTYKILHGRVTCLVDALRKLEDVMRKAVDYGYADIKVVFVLIIEDQMKCA